MERGASAAAEESDARLSGAWARALRLGAHRLVRLRRNETPLAEPRAHHSGGGATGPLSEAGSAERSPQRGANRALHSARQRRALSSVVEDEDAAVDLAGLEGVVGLVDLAEAVASGDQLVDLEASLAVELHEPGHVVGLAG